jgi:hypothetical protein
VEGERIWPIRPCGDSDEVCDLAGGVALIGQLAYGRFEDNRISAAAWRPSRRSVAVWPRGGVGLGAQSREQGSCQGVQVFEDADGEPAAVRGVEFFA